MRKQVIEIKTYFDIIFSDETTIRVEARDSGNVRARTHTHTHTPVKEIPTRVYARKIGLRLLRHFENVSGAGH